MTKKQITALNRIIRRASKNAVNETIANGEFRSGEKYAVTDGAVGVVYDDSIQELSNHSTGRNDLIEKMIDKATCQGDYFRVESITEKDLQKAIHAKKIVKISTVDSCDNQVYGFFNPRLVIDAIQAVGNKSVMYIGNINKNSKYNNMLILKDGISAIIMPLRTPEEDAAYALCLPE